MAQSNPLDITCRPTVGEQASVLIYGPAPDLIKGLWPNAAHKLPESENTLRFDLAIFVDAMATLGERHFQQSLAAARDRWAKQVMVLTTQTSNTHALEELYFSLGFTRRPLPDTLSENYFAFCYSISHYKNTPDWLNSKFWANPERWNKR